MDIVYLKNNNLILFEAISGSKAFGLATDKSDTDIRGIFYMPKDQFYGLDYLPQIANETNDEVYYEVGRFVELLLKNNPNILEILATPKDCILYKHPLMDLFKIEDFLSKLCKDTFGGYALTQIHKARGLNKKIVNPISEHRKTILDFCFILEGSTSKPFQEWLLENSNVQENCGLVKIPNSKGMYSLFYDDTQTLNYRGIITDQESNEVCLSSIPKGELFKEYLFFNQDAYSIYCKEYKDYWKWIEERNSDRFETNKKHGKNYDSKNMMHTIRLLQSAVHIFENETLNVRVENREELLNIKKGNLNYEDLIKYADNLISEMNDLHKNSKLPDGPNFNKAQTNLVEIRTRLYQ